MAYDVVLAMPSPLSLLLSSAFVAAPAATPEPGMATWVWLDSKGVEATPQALAQRADELSPRALARRRRARGDLGVDARDLAIAPARLAAIAATGARIRVVSRWLDAVSVEADAATRARLRALPWVRQLAPVAAGHRGEPRLTGTPHDAGGVDPTYGVAFDQLQQIGVPELHACGLSGDGVVVGVLDSGFVLDHAAFAGLDVIAAHDFIHDDDIVADEQDDLPGQHNHGTWVLSLLAGHVDGLYSGAAPGISVLLAKTEDISQEQPIEEDYYVAGLEWIESMGADMSTASLGYFAWYGPEQLDGHTAVTTQAAVIALDNGLIMFESMGNAGPAPTSLGAPSDADRLVAVGAVQPDGVLADFSSRGPTSDGRIKPDVCGPGHPAWVVDLATPDQYGQASGTSLAAPLVAGVGALLLQAYPELGPQEMVDLLRDTASRAAMPDNDYGWGIVQGPAAAGLYCTCHDVDDDGAWDLGCGGDDCDDLDDATQPGAPEQCDGRDNDCDGTVPAEEDDVDGDGVRACAGDCDDDDPAVHPGALEACGDARDGDCDGLADADDPDCAAPGTSGSDDSGGGHGSSSAATSDDATGGELDTSAAGSSDGGPAAAGDGGGCACDAAGGHTCGAAPTLWMLWLRRRTRPRRR